MIGISSPPTIDVIALPAVIVSRSAEGGWLLQEINEAFRSQAPLDWVPEDARTVRETLPIAVAQRLEDFAEQALLSDRAVIGDLKVDGPGGGQSWRVSCGAVDRSESLILIIADIEDQPSPEIQARMQAFLADDNNISPFMEFATCTVGRDGVLKSASAQLANILGANLADLPGTSLIDRVMPSQRDAVSDLLRDWSPDHGTLTRAAKLMGQGGLPTSVLATLLPAEDPSTLQLVIIDVSRIRHMMAEVRVARDEAQQQNQAKASFLANMSHELKTPLNGIVGFSEIINQEVLGPVGNKKYVEYAGDINFSAKHLTEIVSDVLDMARAESDAIQLEETMINLEELLEEVASLAKPACQQFNVRFHYSLSGKMVIYADRRLIRQAMINLVYNGIKFSSAGGVVTADVRMLANGGCAIVVNDTGIGIESSRIHDALTPFVTLKSNQATALGTGLGLPLSRAFMELHEGKLSINSELGSGTSVFCTFPKDRVVYSEMVDNKGYRGLKMSEFSYDVDRLSALLDAFTPSDFDSLPYGVIKLDRHGIILEYNAIEGKFSGLLADEVIGKNYFKDVAPCTALTDFENRFHAGMEAGQLNEFFDFVFNFPGRPMNVQIHLKSSPSHDGAWAFVHWV